MNKIMTKWQALSVVISGIAFLAILTVFPLRIWHEPIEEVSNRIEEGTIKLYRKGPVADQMFVAQYDHLDGIDLLVKEASEKVNFTLCVYDEYRERKRKETYRTSEKGIPQGRVYIPLNLDTKVGKQYYYTVKCTKGEMQIAYEVTETSGFIYSGPSHLGEEALGGCNLITGYHYGQPLRKVKSALVLSAILACAVLLVGILRVVNRKTGRLSELVTLQWGVKAICNPLIVVGTVVGIIAVGPLYLFSYQYADIVMFILGVLFLGILLWTAVNRTYARAEESYGWERVFDRLPDILQSLCVAMALLACIHYMNGLYEVFHDIAYREMLIWLALAMIVTYAREELFNLWNLAGLALSAVPAFRYYRVHLPEMANEYETRVLKLTCYLVVLITIVAIHTVSVLVRRKVRYVNLLYFLATAVTAAGMIIMRNERWWPVMMVVAFSLFGIYYAAWSKKDRFLNNLLNGILFNFAGTTVFCLLHRPYQSFLYIRYPQIFHTVTVTATYLAVVLAAALVKLLYKYNREKSWRACFFEMAIFGTVSCYVLFTMSRTGMLGVAAVILVTWIIAVDGAAGPEVESELEMKRETGGIVGKTGRKTGRKTGMKKRRIPVHLRALGMMFLSFLFLFPVCFSAQRILPAVVKQPVEYAEIEHFFDDVVVGENPRTENYITVDRFLEIFADKMLGIPSDNTINLDQYCIKKERYNRTRTGNNRPAPGMYLPRDNEVEIDYTNGRTGIYKSYLAQLTLEGHKEMGALLEDGTLAYHAHNNYLQFAFDHGIIMGIVFIVWLVITVVYTWLYFWRCKGKNAAAALPLSITVLFAVAGVVEWISHPCNPAGFVFPLVLMPILFDDFKSRNSCDKKR